MAWRSLIDHWEDFGCPALAEDFDSMHPALARDLLGESALAPAVQVGIGVLRMSGDRALSEWCRELVRASSAPRAIGLGGLATRILMDMPYIALSQETVVDLRPLQSTMTALEYQRRLRRTTASREHMRAIAALCQARDEDNDRRTREDAVCAWKSTPLVSQKSASTPKVAEVGSWGEKFTRDLREVADKLAGPLGRPVGETGLLGLIDILAEICVREVAKRAAIEEERRRLRAEVGLPSGVRRRDQAAAEAGSGVAESPSDDNPLPRAKPTNTLTRPEDVNSRRPELARGLGPATTATSVVPATRESGAGRTWADVVAKGARRS